MEPVNLDLAVLYAEIRRRTPDDPIRVAAATASPLCLAMHLNHTIRPYDHAAYLDAHLVALADMRLYKDGPGPTCEVWIRDRDLTDGEWVLEGHGYNVVVSERVETSAEVEMLRPGWEDRAEKPGRGMMPKDIPPDWAIEDDKVQLKLGIAMPPRHGKSMLVSEYFPLWMLLRLPTAPVMLASYNSDFAQSWGKNLREKYDGSTFRTRMPMASDGLPLIPTDGNTAVVSFRPGKDTGQISFRGVGGSATGSGFIVGIIDDPFKDAEEAKSRTIRENKGDWYAAVFDTRDTRMPGMPPPIQIMMFTRWHEDDLCGRYVLEEDGETARNGWCYLRLPALAEDNDPLGRAPGAALCPAIRRRSWLLDKQDQDPLWFACLFQGVPVHEQGGTFQKPFNHYRYEPGTEEFRASDLQSVRAEECLYLVTIDLAVSKKTKADWTVYSLWAWHPHKRRLILIDRLRKRMSSNEHKPELMAFLDHNSRWTGGERSTKLAFIGIEEATFGISLLQELRRDCPWLPIRALPHGNEEKYTRALGYAAAVNDKMVWFPSPDACRWLVEWENEHVKFGQTTHDDQVDTGAMAWTECRKYSYDRTEARTDAEDMHERARRHIEKKKRRGSKRRRGSFV